MLRIATFNINGIRAAQRRGFERWLAERGADVVALQEVRAQADLVPHGAFGDHTAVYVPGTLPGRNGVAVLTRTPPAAVRTWDPQQPVWVSGPREALAPLPVEKVGDTGPLARELREFVHEGRYVEVDLAETPLTVASLYVPKGGLPAELQQSGRTREPPDGGAKHLRKMRFLTGLAKQLGRSRRAARARGREFLVMGDANVAHQNFDVANWRGNQKSEGFLPVERAWMDETLTPRSFVDVVRARRGEVPGPYSWWSWRGAAFTNDVGWRIDYHWATPALARAATADATDRDPSADSRISDHCPVVVDYDVPVGSHADTVTP